MTEIEQKSFDRFKTAENVNDQRVEDRRFGYVIGYEESQKDFIEKASGWLKSELRGIYDWETIEDTISKFKNDMSK